MFKTSHLSFYNSVPSSGCPAAREDIEGGDDGGGGEGGQQQQEQDEADGHGGVPPSEGQAGAAGRILRPGDPRPHLLLHHHLLHLLHRRLPPHHWQLPPRTKICWLN